MVDINYDVFTVIPLPVAVGIVEVYAEETANDEELEVSCVTI